MARGTRFPNLMRTPEFSSHPAGYPVESFKRDVRDHNAKLADPVPEEALGHVEQGLDRLGGSEATLLPCQRNLINNYLISVLYMTELFLFLFFFPPANSVVMPCQ